MRRVIVLAVVLAAGCGGGGARQDADEPSGDFKVEVVSASFPRTQHIAQTVQLRVRVRNADTRALPVAVTVETAAPAGVAPSAFGQGSSGGDQADSTRPIWVLDRGPRGGDTAAVDTWSAGPLRPGQSRVLTWRLVAAKAGTYTVAYRVSPGLAGRAKAAAGGRTEGRFRVTIDDEPVPARVGDDGGVIRGGSDRPDS
jgi:hypothetical protein